MLSHLVVARSQFIKRTQNVYNLHFITKGTCQAEQEKAKMCAENQKIQRKTQRFKLIKIVKKKRKKVFCTGTQAVDWKFY